MVFLSRGKGGWGSGSYFDAIERKFEETLKNGTMSFKTTETIVTIFEE